MSDVLRATLIDVGWGDSILLEAEWDEGGEHRHVFGLIDCNDTVHNRSAYLFVKRRFERLGLLGVDERGADIPRVGPLFQFVLLSHGHADHGSGLRQMIQEFGTRWFWYPKSDHRTLVSKLVAYARRASAVEAHQSVDSSKVFDPAQPPIFGPVKLSFLWPPHNRIDTDNENLNSVVLLARLGAVSFLFTADAEASVWPQILPLPGDLRVIQAPHHGAQNGLFDGPSRPWLDALPAGAIVAMSSHVVPHHHPDRQVVEALDAAGFETLRTDRHYHLVLETDGTEVARTYHRLA
jgi:beta-lactamase superfamily II metal-dependent hydrolase